MVFASNNSRKSQVKSCKCKYQSSRCCFHSLHCDIFSCSTGNVDVCFLNLNPNGRFTPRKFVSRSGF